MVLEKKRTSPMKVLITIYKYLKALQDLKMGIHAFTLPYVVYVNARMRQMFSK